MLVILCDDTAAMLYHNVLVILVANQACRYDCVDDTVYVQQWLFSISKDDYTCRTLLGMLWYYDEAAACDDVHCHTTAWSSCTCKDDTV